MSRLARKSVSLSALAMLVLGGALALMLPAISAGAGSAQGEPRLSFIIHGLGNDVYTVHRQGDPKAACQSGRRVHVSATIGGAAYHPFPVGEANAILGQAFCNRFSVAVIGDVHDPGKGRFSSDGPDIGAQIGGPPECVGKYDAGDSVADSAWIVVCRFF